MQPFQKPIQNTDLQLPVNLHECAYTPLLLCALSAKPTHLSSYLNIYKDFYYCINYLLIYNLKDL